MKCLLLVGHFTCCPQFLLFIGDFNKKRVGQIGVNDKTVKTEYDLNYSRMKCLPGMAKHLHQQKMNKRVERNYQMHFINKVIFGGRT